MKKLLVAMLLLAGTAGIGTNSFASDCKNVDFDNGNVCVNIEKVSGETFKLTTDTSNGTLRCGVLLADKPYKDVACNGGTFSVNDLDTQLIKIFIKQGSEVPSDWEDKPSTASKWLFPQWNYDFDAEEWADGSSSSSSSSSNGDVSDYTITLADSTPSAGDEVKLTLKAVDSSSDTVTDYDGSNAKVTIAYRSSSSSSWTTTTSSTYFSIDDNTPNFSNGVASTYITFKKDYDYRITVTDESDDSIYTQKTIYTNGSSSSSSSSNGDVSDYTITLADSTPAEDDEVKLTVKAVDSSDDTVTDYDGSNAEITVEYRTSSSSSWKDATSSYISIDDTTPNFSNGSASTYITFKYGYDYRITVTDQDDDSIYTQKTIYVDSSSSSSSSSSSDVSDYTITLADSTPSAGDEVKLTLKAVDSSDDTVIDYDGSNAKITIAYRSSSSSSWTTTTSSTYFSIDDNTPNFSNGVAYTYITFKKSYDYRITVTDESDDSIYTQKTIYTSSSNSSSNSDVSDYTITLADSTPAEDDEVKLTIKAIDSSDDTVTDYDGSNAEITVEYRTSSSSSWKDATSTYFNIDDSTPNFSNGSASTYITFKYGYDYRITVTDQDDDSIYTQKTIYVDSSSSSSSSSNSDFSSSELRTIKNIYSTWNSSISDLESESYKLRNNSTRQNMSDDLYSEMKKIINDDSDKLYDNMDEFQTAFNKRYKYTTQNK